MLLPETPRGYSLEAINEFRQRHLWRIVDEQIVRKMPERYSDKVVWGSKYPNQDTMSAWEAIEMLRASDMDEAVIA